MKKLWANINSGVRGSCSFSVCWELHLSWQGWNLCLQRKYRSAFPRGPWLMSVLHNFLPEVSRSWCTATAGGHLVIKDQCMTLMSTVSGVWFCRKSAFSFVKPISLSFFICVAQLCFKNKMISLNTAHERLLQDKSTALKKQSSWWQCCNSFAFRWLQLSSPQKLD